MEVNFLYDAKIVDVNDKNYSYKSGQYIFIKQKSPCAVDTDKFNGEQIIDIFAASYLNGRYLLDPTKLPKKKIKCKLMIKLYDDKSNHLGTFFRDAFILKDGTLKVIDSVQNFEYLTWDNCREVVVKKLINKVGCTTIEEFNLLKDKINSIDKLINEFDKIE